MESDSEESKHKNISNSITRRHIARLHDRVQMKYGEMQKKLQKSKSIDILTSLNEDDVFNNYSKHVSTSDISTLSEGSEISINYSIKRESMAFLSANKNDAIFYEVKHKEPETASIINNDAFNYESEEQKNNGIFLFDVPFKGSLESLNEEAKDSDESFEPSTPNTKSLRSRIESKIREATRRRKIEKEKYSKTKKDDRVERFIFSNTTKEHFAKVINKKSKIATVTVALIEITGLEELEEERPRSLSCRLRLGSEKRKSKLIKSHASSVKFQELHNFNLYDDDYIVEIVVWDKDIHVGRCVIDLNNMEKEKTHRLRISLEDFEQVKVYILLTISGLALSDTVFSIDESEAIQETEEKRKQFTWYRIFDQFSNVGWMSVIVYGAKGLSAQDCYCILSLDNEWKHTATDYKTNSPSWMKVYTFEITDITSILEVKVCDERKGEEVGKISIPLLSITPGKKWYALKDSTQRERAKGNNPRILLEMKVFWNLVKASLKVINPKEVNLLHTDEKLDRHVLVRNISRGKVVTMWVINAFKLIKTCFEWESTKLNIISLTGWLIMCYFFKIWMLPLLLLVPFFIYRPKSYCLIDCKYFLFKIIPGKKISTKTETDDKSLRQKLHEYQETILAVQNFIGTVASLGESIKNLYNFSVPFVSFLAIFLIICIALIMFLIPLQYILMVWGIHKFTRKILKPNRIAHNEILDLLSRVPDDITLHNYQEIPLEHISDDEI
ncbi:multiple C2 and transmembrane domain-containing protein-like [Zerene cesonia]|uniref:multiple C2 and transmembrane domain-containing protein-like n=1 Tax=Zerene cesonia TaxID=33412 RepID=UPI0018E57701|nr:multiple C2 and transmembrane domain-containing protein-like [Zerene cesonia]